MARGFELLLKTELRRPGGIAKVPVAWIDSEAASTTTGLQPYLSMLKAIVAMYRRYLPPAPEAEALAALIEGMSEEDWAYLSEHVPPAIADGDPLRFSEERPIGAAELYLHRGASPPTKGPPPSQRRSSAGR